MWKYSYKTHKINNLDLVSSTSTISQENGNPNIRLKASSSFLLMINKFLFTDQQKKASSSVQLNHSYLRLLVLRMSVLIVTETNQKSKTMEKAEEFYQKEFITKNLKNSLQFKLFTQFLDHIMTSTTTSIIIFKHMWLLSMYLKQWHLWPAANTQGPSRHQYLDQIFSKSQLQAFMPRVIQAH